LLKLGAVVTDLVNPRMAYPAADAENPQRRVMCHRRPLPDGREAQA
jgi:hypothetical protein